MTTVAGNEAGDKKGQAYPRKGNKVARQEMPTQPGLERVKNFCEVNLGMGEETALLEASRCLRCPKPKCVESCPVAVDIPGFVGALADGDMEKAAEILQNTNVLPCATGRVCPQEIQCESQCILLKKGKSVAIGHLERYVADWALNQRRKGKAPETSTGRKVAVVGSGPGGLTCAGELRRMGHEVVLFEALHVTGGVLRYGIPEFRLPKDIVEAEVQKLRDAGVQIVCNAIIGATYTLEGLLREWGFDAVFISVGAGFPVFLGIPGEGLKGVYSANEFLTRVNLMGASRGGSSSTPVLTSSQVVVIGGGNTALDAIRTARRLGALGATLVYRRSRAEMPARLEEVEHAEQEGVSFELLANPIEILSDKDGWVRGVKCVRMQLSEPDESGRRRPLPIKGSEFEVPCKVVIEAIGTRANPLLTRDATNLKLDKHGYIEADEKGMTSIPGVFAGGDIVRGGASVILAMGDGKKAAMNINAFLNDSLDACSGEPSCSPAA